MRSILERVAAVFATLAALARRLATSKFSSRKFLLAVAGAVTAQANGDHQMAVGILVAYVLAEAGIDAVGTAKADPTAELLNLAAITRNPTDDERARAAVAAKATTASRRRRAPAKAASSS